MRSLFSLVGVLVVVVGCGGGGGGPTFAEDHPRIYLAHNLDRLKASLDAGDAAALKFQDMVDRELANPGEVYDFQAWFAALMGKLTGDPKYCARAVQQTDDTVNAELAAIDGGSAPQAARDDYLYVGPEVGDIMMTYDWCFDVASSDQKTRWLDFSAQAVNNIWNPETASWGGTSMPWNGWAIDDPSDNYYYSFLRATMLFGLAAHGEEPGADEALDMFRTTKIENQLVPTFTSDLEGGGSREGTGYGVAMHTLWQLYDLWQGSTDENIADLTPHTRASLLYWLHAAMPTRDRMAPIGDHARDSTASLFDYDRDYIQILAYLYQDDPLTPKAKSFLETSSVPEMSQQFMYPYDFLYETNVASAPMDTMGTAFYGPGTGDVFARSGWDTGATWVSLIAGPYTQSHAHRDQGSILVYKNTWLAYDPEIDSHSGLTQQEETHNLVRFDDGGTTVQQQYDTTSMVTALHKGDGYLDVQADLGPAYGGDSRVTADTREMVFIEPDTVAVFDHVNSTVSSIWTMNTPTQPTVTSTRMTAGALQIDRVAPTSVSSSVYDWTQDPDFSGGFRYDETVAAGDHTMVHVLSIGGSVTAVTGSDTTAAITLADGRHVSIDFAAHTMDLDGTSVSLGSGVDSLPE